MVISKMNGCVLEIILNRSQKLNALNPQVINQLTTIFSTLSLDPHLRLIYLSGSGSSFCAGADLQWMAASRTFNREENNKDVDKLFQMYISMHECSLPIIAEVHGYVFGGGVGLCAAADIVIADQNAVFALSEAKRGIIPAVMLPFILDKLGKSRTRELLITGRRFSTAQAKDFGLVHFTTTKKNKASVTKKIIQDVISCSPSAISQCRSLIDSAKSATRKYLVQSLATQRMSAEAKEGIDAFFEKRLPIWAHAKWRLSHDNING